MAPLVPLSTNLPFLTAKKKTTLDRRPHGFILNQPHESSVATRRGGYIDDNLQPGSPNWNHYNKTACILNLKRSLGAPVALELVKEPSP